MNNGIKSLAKHPKLTKGDPAEQWCRMGCFTANKFYSKILRKFGKAKIFQFPGCNTTVQSIT